MLTHHNWQTYFENNKTRRVAIPWEQGIFVEPSLRAPLTLSLQKFQLGESGEGRKLKQCAAATGDPAYINAIHLFIEEEQRHSALLARILQSLGAPLLQRHWTNYAFVLLRHLVGLKLEVIILLTAEMIAKRYYRALHEGIRDPVLRTVFGQIRKDEEGHISFHCDMLNLAFASRPALLRFGVYALWQGFMQAVSLLVAIDHAPILTATGVTPFAFWHDCNGIFIQCAKRIFLSSTLQTEPISANVSASQ
ncbi:MAG: ferritin-like domain-containing protein [Anaerolineales bacterium]